MNNNNNNNSESIDDIFQNAQKAQYLWSEYSLNDRMKILNRAAELVNDNVDKLASCVTKETGRANGVSKFIIGLCCQRMKYYISQAEKNITSDYPKSVCDPDLKLETVYEPLGVLGFISAWNFPVLMACDYLAPALVCGNAVMFKPSEYAPLCCIELCKLFEEAGLPKYVLNCVVGDGNIGQQICDLNINALTFIGSQKVGRMIATRMASRMIPLHLEMGGKDGMLVWKDANIKQAASSLAEGTFVHSGQSCDAVERIYVHHDIYDEFMQTFKQAVEELGNNGDVWDEATFLGPQVRGEDAIKELEEQINDALNKGASIVLGGKRDKTKNGYFFQPTIVTNVTHEMKVMQEETFGPIIGVMKLDKNATIDDAIFLLNDVSFGLTGGIYTMDKELCEYVHKRLKCGSVHWNTCGSNEPCQPWSGRQGSGFGHVNGQDFRSLFLQPKARYLRNS